MLTKLMKHELRATSRIMLPLFLIVLATAFCAHFFIYQMVSSDHPILYALGVLSLTAFVLSICGVCVIAFVLMIQRFYRNLLQDEGYMMMTLPVSIHHHIWAKFLVSLIWYTATIAVILLAFFILSFRMDFLTTFIHDLKIMFSFLHWDIEYVHIILSCIEYFIVFALSYAHVCFQVYAALAISHSFSKHKLLYFFLIFFGLQLLLQFLIALLMFFIPLIHWDNIISFISSHMSMYAASHIMLLCMTVVSSLYTAVFYFLTVYFLRHRLNLE